MTSDKTTTLIAVLYCVYMLLVHVKDKAGYKLMYKSYLAFNKLSRGRIQFDRSAAQQIGSRSG